MDYTIVPALFPFPELVDMSETLCLVSETYAGIYAYGMTSDTDVDQINLRLNQHDDPHGIHADEPINWSLEYDENDHRNDFMDALIRGELGVIYNGKHPFALAMLNSKATKHMLEVLNSAR